MKRFTFTTGGMVLTASLLLMAPLALTGCQNKSSQVDLRPDIGFAVTSSHTSILVGETVTFTVRTTDTLGRDVDVKWSTTGGDLDTEQGNRIARVKFDNAGTYSVKADLYLDGNINKSDSRTIVVRPIR